MSGTSENAVELDSLIVGAESIGAYANWPDDSIRWISEGREVARGASLSLSSTPDLGCYVRAVIHGADGARTLTQPIGLAEHDVELRPSVHHTPSLRIRVSARETADGNRRIVCNSSTPVGVRVFDASGKLVLVSHVSRTRPVVLDHRHARGVLIAQVRPGRDSREAASTEILTIE